MILRNSKEVEGSKATNLKSKSEEEIEKEIDEEGRIREDPKIFDGGCPNELLKAGMEIAKNCRGLPLSVVTIAGLLERTEKQQASWKSILESLSARLIDDPQTQCMDIIQLSYMHLPNYLKACLLYFGSFLEDEDIPVSKLIRLWIAEGFIRQTVVCSLENLAENYLTDLIGRSMIAVAKKGPKGRVKSCCLHDMIRDFCLSKAKEENFFQVITRYDEPFTSFDDFDCGADFIDHYPPKPTSDISFIPHHFKLLRVLDLECINMGISFPPGIELLVQLRYLAVSGDIDFIPPSISNLRKLESFIVKGLKGKVVLPDSIWSMERLRHLHVNTHVDFNFQDDKPGNSLKLVNLVSFSLPSIARGKAANMILRRMPNLSKFECIYLESWDAYTNYNRFRVLDLLIHLESLKILYVGRALNPGELNLPWNLKKLTLSSFRLPWTHISAIGRLPNLEVLKLVSRAFEGPRWDMREVEFLGLKYLKLDSLNIVQWNASSDHLPNLQQLHLQNCKDVEEVPLAFADINTLQMIEVQSCGLTTEESVKRIGNECMEGLKIIINNKIHL
ncbi:putative late blight resistance protein homolog R1B-17 [Coffea arabica]|uniref:Late blight resistance protein homolog R1B-17 n=1 Tax=Coffea arabica TaxID=13443 RepID=A0ABM4VHJ4_COFAR